MMAPAAHLVNAQSRDTKSGMPLTNRRSQIDPPKHAQVEHGRLEATLVDEPDIRNGCGHKCFHRSHTEPLDRAGGSEAAERLGLGSPKARDHKAYRGCNVYRPFPELDGQGVADEAGDRDGCNAGALEAQRELLQGNAELCGQWCQGRCE